MLVAANQMRKEVGADVIVTGEVLGQRAANQSRRQIDLITYHSGAAEVLYRPLSAAFLGAPGALKAAPSLSISGSGRRPIKDLAKKLGIPDIDRPGPQCRLSDPGYMARLDDLLVHQAEVDFVDVELLLHGRHYRLNRQAKAIVGRNAADNEAIAVWHSRHQQGRLFVPANFQGPTVLLFGEGGERDSELAMSLAAMRKSALPPEGCQFQADGRLLTLATLAEVESFKPIQAG
jgi:hypothetical protein